MITIGIMLALGSAFSNTLENIILNRVKKNDTLSMNFIRVLSAFLIMLPIALVQGITIKSWKFWPSAVFSGVLFAILTVYYAKAIKESGISHTVPLLSITPIFMIVVAMVALGEIPNIFTSFGILSIVVGAYLLNISRFREGIFEPFKHIAKEKGTRLMLLVAIFFSIAGTNFKYGISQSDTVTMLLFDVLFASITMLVLVIWRKKVIYIKKTSKKDLFQYGVLGLLIVTGDLMLGMAMTMMFVSYAASIKRTSILFTVISGKLMFNEEGFLESLTGTIFMLAGIFLIGIFG